MKLYDALMYLGRPIQARPEQWSDVASLRRALDRYGISKALLVSFTCKGVDPLHGNDLIFAACKEDERLVPCPAVLPASTLETESEAAFIDGLIRRGARCVCLFPQKHGTGLDQRVVGPLCEALQARRMPLALFETELLDAATLAAAYPDMPVICHVPGYRNRKVVASLRQAPNLHVSLAPNFAPYQGVETICEQCGDDRLVLATGFPMSEPGVAISQLLYSDVDESRLANVAWANLDRLMSGVIVGGDGVAARRQAETPATGRVGGVCDHVWHRQPLPWPGIVDMHAHYGRWTGFPFWGGDADDLVAGMDRVGVEKIMVAHHVCMATENRWGNDQVLEAMRRHPDRILGYATCYPAGDTPPLDEIRRCIEAGMSGIKLHNGNGVPYTDEGYAPVWQYADDLRLPVLLHTWGDMDKMTSVFERWRRAPILLAHSGSCNVEQYVDCARRYSNVYLEICYSPAPYGMVEHLVREVGTERVLVGSDAPWMPVQHQFARVLFADIPDAAKKTIMVENPRRILKGR